jgi:hypothetical protein
VAQSESFSEKTDYETETSTFILAANYLVNEKLNLSFTGTYTDSTAEMDQLNDYTSSVPAAMAATYDYDLSTVHTYSDLDVAQTDLSVAANYQVADNVSVGCGFTYLRYDDDEPYLEDGAGEAYITDLSVSYLF